MNAANATGDVADHVAGVNVWPSLQKFDNDESCLTSFSPFGCIPNPNYIWFGPPSDGQTVAFASASEVLNVFPGDTLTFSVFFRCLCR